MKKAIIAKKIGMTQIFMDDGRLVPVTVLEAGPCTVTQVKTIENDGYKAVQMGFMDKKEHRTNKPDKGHFDKSGSTPKKVVKEFRLDDSETYEAGQVVKADVFAEGDVIDVVGTSKGKGFAGSIKRHGFGRGPMGHGSKYHRSSGSMGQASSPSKVFKGKKLPGHMGHERVTVQNLKVVRVDAETNTILVKGAVPGPRKSIVTIRDAVKA